MATLANLTQRETEILQMVLTGQTNKSIASAMFISEKTVEFHLHQIYNKIGMRSRTLASIWALQHGIALKTREIPR